jgi:secreted trypsin-like serine protease
MAMRLARTILGIGLVVCTTAVFAQSNENRALRYGAPWQAQIYSPSPREAYTKPEEQGRDYWELAHRCGGSLIQYGNGEGWVLTAAHCVFPDMISKGYRIRLGARDLELDDGATYRIDRFVKHSRYDDDSHLNDIAVIHFVTDETTGEEDALPIRTIPIYDGPLVEDGLAVTATGWGKTAHQAGEKATVELMQANVQIVDCDAFLPGKTTEGMLCAGSDDGQDSCTNDSGGPLVKTYGPPVLVGIISWGKGCGNPDKPGVYVRLDRDHYGDWIGRAMRADPSVKELD